MKKRIFAAIVSLLVFLPSQAQIMLSPYIESTIGGLTENNMTIAENRLRNIISSNGMASGYGGRFALACKISALERNMADNMLAQELEITFAVGDDFSGTCFSSTSIEVVGIGKTEGQAMTAAIKNIKSNPKLKAMVAQAKQRIIDYYEKNGPNIIRKAQGLVTAQQWEEALYELTAIPEECSCYKQALDMMESIYKKHLDHDAAQLLSQAQAIWSSDPNPGWAADQATALLGQIDTSAECYPQAQALMKKIHNRVKNVTEREYADNKAKEQAMFKANVALEKARIEACRDVAVAYAKRKVTVNHHYHSWF